jgi:membrane protein
MLAKLKPFLQSAAGLVKLALRRFSDDRCLQVAGDLTFTTLLALVPLFTIAFTLFTAFPVFEDWANAFKIFLLTTLVPEMGGKVITVYMQQFADNAAKLTAIGLIFLAVTALLLIATIEKVFNAIWRARRPRPAVQRLMIYWAALTVGPLLIGASLSLTSWLVTQSMVFAGETGQVKSTLLRVFPVFLNGIAFGLLYLTLPNRRVLVRDAVIGGVVAAVAFELMKRGFGLYVQLFPTYSLIYGTFATVPIFLLWIYLSWIVVLSGAVVAAVLPHWRLGLAPDSALPEVLFYRVLRLIELLYEGHRRSAAPSMPELVAASGIAEEETEFLLERLEALRWARRVQPAGWVLARDLDTLRVVDVYGQFVLRAGGGAVHGGALLQGVTRLLGDVEGKLDVSLRALVESTESTIPAAKPD